MRKSLIETTFIELFQGKKDIFGHHRYASSTEKGVKEQGKSWTENSIPISDQHYKDHLNGKLGLGIVPITNENKCKFVVIDFDIYDNENLCKQIIESISVHNLPLVVFTSKSGGLHLYLFFKAMISVKEAHGVLEQFRKLLAIDILYKMHNKRGLEIFPKQVILRKGDNGNWINLPYYNYQSKECNQIMVHNGKNLSLEEALITINNDKINYLNYYKEFIKTLEYMDSPPCLQSMYYLNEDISQRNNYLFSWGVYFNKKDANTLEEQLHAMNQSLPKPLPHIEIDNTVLRSVVKKGYSYKCNESPCLDFCDKTACKQRQYGIGGGGIISDLDFGQLKQFKTDPPYYEWEVNNTRLRFDSEDDILNQSFFRKICFRILHYVPPFLKQFDWAVIVNKALEDIEIIYVDAQDDIAVGGMLRHAFSDFVLNRPLGTNKLDLMLGKVLYEEEHYVFRSKDFISYLDRKRIPHTRSIHGFLRDISAVEKRIHYTEDDTKKHSTIRSWVIPKKYFDLRDEYRLDTPQSLAFVPDILTEETLGGKI